MPTRPSTVANCVATLCSTYHEGANILAQIKAKRRGLDISAQDLEISVTRAGSVSRQYASIYKGLGEPFANGDHVAIDAIKRITAHLQTQVIMHLEAYYQQGTNIDFAALQDVCDCSQNEATLVLKQLRRRVLTSAALPAGPLGFAGPTPISHKAANPTSTIPEVSTPYPESVGDAVSGSYQSKSPCFAPSVLPPTPSSPQASLRPESALSRTSIGSHNTARRNLDPYKPMATTVTKTGFFGIVRRIKVEPILSPPENPLVDEYLADVLEGNGERLSQTALVKATGTSTQEPDRPAYVSQRDYQSPGTRVSFGPSESSLSFKSVLRTHSFDQGVLSSGHSNYPTGTKDLLPNEANKYAGFCKGAWRQQVGDTNRAMEERIRPGGMYNQAKYWQCKHCRFEGRLIPVDEKKSGYDMRVFKLVERIQFRWNFMFKSHVAGKDVNSNPTKATFGCIFCCSSGRGTPAFAGIQNFMDHLVEHREQLPTGEVLHRMNCLVGRQATIDEDFDVNLISPDGDHTQRGLGRGLDSRSKDPR